MNEREWLASEDPAAMLDYVRGNDGPPSPTGWHCRISDRKLRLFACACCRQVWEQLTDPRSLNAVEVAERHADGLATEAELSVAMAVADNARDDHPVWDARDMAGTACLESAIQAAEEMLWVAGSKHANLLTPSTQAALLRNIVGNPFRKVVLPIEHHPSCDAVPEAAERAYSHCSCPCPWLTRNDGAVPKLARVIYNERRWDLTPILADALEDANCGDEVILRHLRGEEPCPCLYGYGLPPNRPQCSNGWTKLRGPHVRGCWVIDLLTGRA